MDQKHRSSSTYIEQAYRRPAERCRDSRLHRDDCYSDYCWAASTGMQKTATSTSVGGAVIEESPVLEDGATFSLVASYTQSSAEMLSRGCHAYLFSATSTGVKGS